MCVSDGFDALVLAERVVRIHREPLMAYEHRLMYQPNCSGCPLRHDTKVLPDGPVPAKLVFVGEGPGGVEVAEGFGFKGASGNLLWMLCQAYGFDRDRVWVTNSQLCKKRDVKLSSGAVILEAQVANIAAECCRKRLIYELMTVTQCDPNAVIVPLGNIALQTLTKRKNSRVYAYRGSIQHVDLRSLWAELCAAA